MSSLMINLLQHELTYAIREALERQWASEGAARYWVGPEFCVVGVDGFQVLRGIRPEYGDNHEWLEPFGPPELIAAEPASGGVGMATAAEFLVGAVAKRLRRRR